MSFEVSPFPIRQTGKMIAATCQASPIILDDNHQDTSQLSFFLDNNYNKGQTIPPSPYFPLTIYVDIGF